MANSSFAVDNVSCIDSIAESLASSSIPSTTESRRRPLETGFECEFVEKPRELQPECPVCLHVLRQPHQVTCCGNSFCKACIERVKKENKPCPTCNEREFHVFHDKRLQHTLYDFHVVCTHKQLGCDWTGELRELESHLNSNPAPAKQLDGCQYETVLCVYCNSSYKRKDIQVHQGSKCGKRPYSCEYCGQYESTCDDVTDSHWPICPCRPIACPNDCGIYPERQNLDAHLAKECTKQMVKCPFTYAGCCATPHPSDLQQHLDNNMSNHLSLVANFSQKLIDITTELSEKVRGLEEQVQKTPQPQSKAHYGFPDNTRSAKSIPEYTEHGVDPKDIRNLLKEIHSLKSLCEERDQAIKEQDKKIKALEQQNQMLCDKVEEFLQQPKVVDDSSIQELRSHLYIVPVVYTVPDVSVRMSQSDLMFKSHPFYTFPKGYKMQLCVRVHGDGSGKGSHVSVFLSLLKGEFDDQLKWPFRGSITIQLLNQENDSQHYVDRINYPDGIPDQMSCRVMDEKRSTKPWGKVKFIAHKDILPTFLKNDCIKFCVGKVDVL